MIFVEMRDDDIVDLLVCVFLNVVIYDRIRVVLARIDQDRAVLRIDQKRVCRTNGITVDLKFSFYIDRGRRRDLRFDRPCAARR